MYYNMKDLLASIDNSFFVSYIHTSFLSILLILAVSILTTITFITCYLRLYLFFVSFTYVNYLIVFYLLCQY